jgi:hypothetical protein
LQDAPAPTFCSGAPGGGLDRHSVVALRKHLARRGAFEEGNST